jgi:Ca2+-transporting ATPase
MSMRIERDTPPAGLSAAEATRRLERLGANELPRQRRRGPWRILVSVLREPMFLLLALAAAIYLAVGDPAEGMLLAGFAVLTIGLVVLQENRSERALEALRALGAPSARVLRDGREQRVPAREVVPGDLLLLGEGERIAADAVLLRADALSVDESLLTGESLAVRKRAQTDAIWPPGSAAAGDDQPYAFAGTLVVAGHGVAQTMATGVATAAGRIGASLASIELGPTLLQQVVGRLVRLFGAFAAVVSIGLVLFQGLLRGDWVEASLAGIALAMSMLPEEFPMALAVFMALGAWRLAQVNVLVRRGAVIETLGAATVLAVDKTGTLTENRMRLRSLSAGGARVALGGDERELPEAFHRLLEYAVLASKRQAFDPMDEAVGALGRATLAATEHLHAEWPLTREYGLSPELPAVSRVWAADAGCRVIAAKGAPEAIATLCRLDPPARAALLAEVETMAGTGLRVLAVASGTVTEDPMPDDPRAYTLHFEGLLGFVDPLRSSARAAVMEARAAGISVAMITGDYPATARAIAAEAGIDLAGGVLSGTDLDALDDAALAQMLRTTRVFARVRPEQKLRLVQAFKADGEVVAMTGDGVNDAPALKAAHIGIAMARRGTDVAREAASIALLDDDFGRIVAGVRLGRRIFDNLRKVMIYIAAIHVPVAGLALLPLLFGLPPLLLPMHVVLIEMVVDPICSLAFENEPEERGIMQRPPRRADEPLVGVRHLLLALVQGLLLLAATLAVHYAARQAGMAEDLQRSLAFIALTAGNLALVRVNGARGATLPRILERGHRVYWMVAIVASLIVASCVWLPAAAALFRFAPPSLAAASLAAAAGIAAALTFDLLKPLPVVRRALGAS